MRKSGFNAREVLGREVSLRDLDIKRHCAAMLPSYKVPQVVEFRAELPRNAAGKVLKRELQ